jgi:hypothetical protein
MHATGIGATLGLFILEAVPFREDVDRDATMIVFEAAQAPRVVQHERWYRERSFYQERPER